MKKSTTFNASSTLLGAILSLSLFGTLAMTSFEAFTDLYTACKCQWQGFAESLYGMQPHRTVFPK